MATPSPRPSAVEWQADGQSMSMHLFKISLPTVRPTDRPRPAAAPADRATTEERTTPTAQGAREAIHNNVDHEMIKRFLVCVRPRPHSARRSLALQGTN